MPVCYIIFELAGGGDARHQLAKVKLASALSTCDCVALTLFHADHALGLRLVRFQSHATEMVLAQTVGLAH